MAAEAQADLDLAQSLAEGLQHADELEDAMREIHGVLADLDDTVRKATNSKVRVSIENPRWNSFELGFDVAYFFQRANANLEERDFDEFEVVLTLASVRSREDTRRLCSMTLSTAGYPVSVDSGGRVDGCYDATALRRSLAAILRRPETGRKLRTLSLRHEEHRSADTADQQDQSNEPHE